jgi:hypothetical protein
MSINFKPPGEVAEAFMHDDAFVQIIVGPVGSGKSTAALFKLLQMAIEQPAINNVRRSRYCILRNTSAQITDSIVPLINQWWVEAAQGNMGSWKVTEKKFTIRFNLPDGTHVESSLWCMAVDTPEDVRRLLSVEFSGAWVEESRELHPEVFSGLQGRVARYPSRAMGGVKCPYVLCTTNPPPIGGFWHKAIVEPPKGWHVFIQPSALLDDNSINPLAENLENLDPEYYDRQIAGKTEEWIDVYLRGKFGIGNAGQPVYKSSFKRSFHVAAEELQPFRTRTYPLVVGLDNGLTAAAAMLQQDPRGRILLLDECYVPLGQTMGVERFLDTMLIPLLRSKYHQCDIVFMLDPACFQRSQVNEETIAQAVVKRGYRVTRAITNDPEKRISSVETLLTRQVDGKAYFVVSPKCRWLIDGFEYGFRYAPRRDGSVNSESPQKNHYSHCHDALQYASMFYGNIQYDTKPQAIKPKSARSSFYYG